MSIEEASIKYLMHCPLATGALVAGAVIVAALFSAILILTIYLCTFVCQMFYLSQTANNLADFNEMWLGSHDQHRPSTVLQNMGPTPLHWQSTGEKPEKICTTFRTLRLLEQGIKYSIENSSIDTGVKNDN